MKLEDRFIERVEQAGGLQIVDPRQVAAGAQADKVKLVMKAEAGQTARYQTEGTITIEADGTKVNLETKDVDKLTFTSVSPSGEITAERENSIRLHAKHGFRMIGTYESLGYKFDRWLDIVHMQRAL